MALTVSIVEHFVVGDRKAVVADITFDSSYDTGGEAITADDLGFRNEITMVHDGVARNATTGAVLVRRSLTTGNLQAFWCAGSGAAAVEVTAATNLSAYTVRVFALGK